MFQRVACAPTFTQNLVGTIAARSEGFSVLSCLPATLPEQILCSFALASLPAFSSSRTLPKCYENYTDYSQEY